MKKPLIIKHPETNKILFVVETDITKVRLDNYLNELSLNSLLYKKSFLALPSEIKLKISRIIQKTHLRRVMAGSKVWNTWANIVKQKVDESITDKKYFSSITLDEQKTNHDFIKQLNLLYEINLSFIKFRKATKFIDFIFPIQTNFSDSEFYEDTYFINSIFHQKTTFIGCSFKKHAHFTYTVFKKRIVFSESLFNKVFFYKTTFHEKSDFIQSTFLQEASFNFSTFNGGNFKRALFKQEIDFSSVTLQDEASFEDAIFYKTVLFTETRFNNKTIFSKATFKKNVDFRQSSFQQFTNFDSATFDAESHQDISFLGSEFKAPCLFTNLQFSLLSAAIPCDFRQVNFKNTPLIDSFPSDLSEFISANKKNKRDRSFYLECEEKFRVLKQLAETNNNHLKAVRFYACELYCHRKQAGFWSNKLNWLYHTFSNYGLSFKKPIYLWIFSMLLCISTQAVIDSKHLSLSAMNEERIFYYASPSFSSFISNNRYQTKIREELYPQFELCKKSKQQHTDDKLCKIRAFAGKVPVFSQIIRVIQEVFTLVCLFLFGLAIRNRFKVK